VSVAKSRPLENVLTGLNGSVLVLSPHLDDAALSCGAVMTVVSQQQRPVTAMTVFSDCGPPPYSFMAKRIVAAMGPQSPVAMMQRRQGEDAVVLGSLGVQWRYLGLFEAPFRRYGRRGVNPPLYPTFRFDALRGRIHRVDRALVAQLAQTFTEVAAQTGAGLVLAPLGVGRHVDHVIVREAATAAFLQDSAGAAGAAAAGPPALWFYADYPYSRTHQPDAAFVDRHGLQPQSWHAGRERAVAALAGYGSQIPVLFDGKPVPVDPEQYWVPQR
jgi:LmbE family N-acetylglucosaminyl deacetylase